MSIHQDFLKRLGERLGLPLTFDEDEQCLLMLDDSLFISIRVSGEFWVLRGMVKEVSPNSNGDGDFWRDLMIMNRELAEQHGGTLGYEPESKALMYLCSLPHPEDVEDVVNRLEQFITQQEKMQNFLQNL